MALNRLGYRGLQITTLKNLNVILFSFREVEVLRLIKLVVCFVVVPENMRLAVLLVCATLQVVHT
jgi:hypothetical protein